MQSALKLLDILLGFSSRPEPLLERIISINRKLSGMRCRYVTAGGILWPYLTGGRGTPIVLLHGFGADKDRFGLLPADLRRRYRVIIPDLPGFGEHQHDWQAVYTIPAQVKRLKIFFSALGLNRFHLLGISLGGYVAGYYASRFPRHVQSLTLMDSAGITSPIRSDAFRLLQLYDQNIFLYTNEAQFQKMIDYLMFRPIKLPLHIRRFWAAQGLLNLSWRRKLFADLFVDGYDRLDETARCIEAPTLVIWGCQDRILHVSCVDKLLKMIPDCRAYVLGDCGHVPLLEYPRVCLRLCRNFLAGQNDAFPRPGRLVANSTWRYNGRKKL